MIYLDNSSTTQVCDGAIAAMGECMRTQYFNPSSLYPQALHVELEIKSRAKRVMQAVGSHSASAHVLYCAGGTEANNLAIFGAASALGRRKGHFVVSAIEHASVDAPYAALALAGHQVTAVPVDECGIIDLRALETVLETSPTMLSVMHVNNETGAIQPLEEIGKLLRAKSPQTRFHVDGVQGFLRVPVAMEAWGVDLYALSAHKIHGPKGVGALVVGGRVLLAPVLRGGEQQFGLRPGTENVPGIFGLDAAIEFVGSRPDYLQQLMAMKLRLAGGLIAGGAKVNGPDVERGAPHIVNVSYEGVRGEVLLQAMAGEGVVVSTGAACSAKSHKVSRVLAAMGLNKARSESALRFSLGAFNTMSEMDEAAKVANRCALALRRFVRK